MKTKRTYHKNNLTYEDVTYILLHLRSYYGRTETGKFHVKNPEASYSPKQLAEQMGINVRIVYNVWYGRSHVQLRKKPKSIILQRELEKHHNQLLTTLIDNLGIVAEKELPHENLAEISRT